MHPPRPRQRRLYMYVPRRNSGQLLWVKIRGLPRADKAPLYGKRKMSLYPSYSVATAGLRLPKWLDGSTLWDTLAWCTLIAHVKIKLNKRHVDVICLRPMWALRVGGRSKLSSLPYWTVHALIVGRQNENNHQSHSIPPTSAMRAQL